MAAGSRLEILEVESARIGLLGTLRIAKLKMRVGSTELQVGQISLGMSIRGGLKALVTVHISNLRALHRSPKENGRKSTPASAKFRSSLHTSAFNRSFVLLARIQSAAKKIHIHIEGLDISNHHPTAGENIRCTATSAKLRTCQDNVLRLHLSELRILSSQRRNGPRTLLSAEQVAVTCHSDPIDTSLVYSDTEGLGVSHRLRWLLCSLPKIDTQLSVTNMIRYSDGSASTLLPHSQMSVLVNNVDGSGLEMVAHVQHEELILKFVLSCVAPRETVPEIILCGRFASAEKEAERQLCELRSLSVMQTDPGINVRADRVVFDVFDIDILRIIRFVNLMQRFRNEIYWNSDEKRVKTDGDSSQAKHNSTMVTDINIQSVHVQLRFAGQVLDAQATDVSFASNHRNARTCATRVLMCGQQILSTGCIAFSVCENNAVPQPIAVTVERLRFCLPHGLHFGNVVKSILTMIKALKMTRRAGDIEVEQSPSQRDGSTPVLSIPAMTVSLSDATLELEDDPMDAWLNGRYQLLRRELEQQEIRLQQLTEQLAARGVKEGSDKFTAATKLLAHDCARRYLSDSQAAKCPREPLFRVCIGTANIELLENKWSTDYETVVAKMRSCDAVEFPAATGAPFGFTDLIATTLRADFHGVSACIRDYNLPLLTIDSLNVNSPLIIAEQSVTAEFWSSTNVCINTGETVATLIKTSSPTKIFHQCASEVNGLCFCYGTAYQPALADIAAAFSRLSADSSEYSQPLQYWDKLRFMFHGSMNLNIHSFTLKILARTNPHIHDEYAAVCAARASVLCVSQNLWKISLQEVDLSLVSISEPKHEAAHLPSINIQGEMHWKCTNSSHFVHSFARRREEAFPNQNPDVSLAILGDRVDKTDRDVYSAFRSHSWNLNLSVEFEAQTNRQAVANEAAFKMWTSSLPWIQNLSRNFVTAPASKSSVIKMSRTKLGRPRKRRQPSLGQLLESFMCRVSFGPAKLLLQNNIDDQHAIQLQSTRMNLTFDMHNIKSDESSKLLQKHEMTKAMFMVVETKELVVQWHMDTLASPQNQRLCQCESVCLSKNLFIEAETVPKGTQQPGRQDRNDLHLQINGALIWFSLENRNFISEWIASAAMHAPEQTATLHETISTEMSTAGGDMLDFLAEALLDDVDGEASSAVNDSSSSQNLGEPVGLALAIQFSRPQIRIKSERGGCVVLTSKEARIEKNRRSLPNATSEMESIVCCLQHAKLFAASEVHFESYVGISSETIESSSACYHEGSGAQQIMAPCSAQLLVHKWLPTRGSGPDRIGSNADTVDLKMETVHLAMDSRQFGTLKDSISMLISRFPHSERLAETKAQIAQEDELGITTDKGCRVAAELELRSKLEQIENEQLEFENSTPEKNQAVESLRARRQECVEALIAMAKDTQRQWLDTHKSLQINVAIESVHWTLLEDSKSISSIELTEIKVRKDMFSNTSSALQFSVEDLIIGRPGQVGSAALCKLNVQHLASFAKTPLLRVLVKQEPSVGGVSVFELLEIHLQPVRISLSQDFLDEIKLYIFPGDMNADTNRRSTLWHARNEGGMTNHSSSECSLSSLLASGHSSTIENTSRSEKSPHRRSQSTDGPRLCSNVGVSMQDLLLQEQHAGNHRQQTTPVGHIRRRSLDCIDPNTMFENLQKSQKQPQAQRSAFGCIRVGEVRLEASYEGTKRFVPNFDSLPLRMNELVYRNKVWTMEELTDRIAWDIARQVGPQAVGKVAKQKFLGRQIQFGFEGEDMHEEHTSGSSGASLHGTPPQTMADVSESVRKERSEFSAQRGRALLFGRDK